MSPAVASRPDLTTSYSREVERLRRLELRTGASPLNLATDWVEFMFFAFGGRPFAQGWFRIHYGCVFLAGTLPDASSDEPDQPGWRFAGRLPDYATPPAEHLVWSTIIPNFGGLVPVTTPAVRFVPVRVLTDGRVLYPATEHPGAWLHGQAPQFNLATSYFPLG